MPQRFFSTTGMPRMLQIQLCTFRPSVRGDKPHPARGGAACNSSDGVVTEHSGSRGAPPKKSRASSEQARDGDVGRDVSDSGTLGAPSVIVPF